MPVAHAFFEIMHLFQVLEVIGEATNMKSIAILVTTERLWNCRVVNI
jgi:hypothetical protein